MKRIVLFAAAFLFASLFVAGGAWAFGVKDVIRMHQDGIADSLILQKIEHSGKNFHLDADDMRDLKRAEVSDEIISAMLATEDQDNDGYGYPHYYYPYYPNYYYPRVTVGLGFGYYGFHGHYRPYYHRGYYRPYTYRGPGRRVVLHGYSGPGQRRYR
jgi:hypothetical protein